MWGAGSPLEDDFRPLVGDRSLEDIVRDEVDGVAVNLERFFYSGSLLGAADSFQEIGSQAGTDFGGDFLDYFISGKGYCRTNIPFL